MVFNNTDFKVPEHLGTNDFLIRPLVETDVELDYAAVIETREFLRRWEQSTWPADDFALADNLKDLQQHEQEHIKREAFTFTVMNPTGTECLGCIYIYPRSVRWLAEAEVTSTQDKEWADYEAVILFWIRQSRWAEAMDRKLLDILRPWFEQEWAFDGHLFMTNEQCTEQVALFEGADLQRQFDIKFPKKAAKDVAYASRVENARPNSSDSS